MDLHGCIQLYDISDKAFGYGHKDAVLPKLEYLDLQQTKMSTLSGNLFDSSNLIGLAFSSTPWNCTCDTAWMLELDLEVIKGPKFVTANTLLLTLFRNFCFKQPF